jgi:RNA polymerase sigma factor (TIGR02999 family)
MGEITRLLDLARHGDHAAQQLLFGRIYTELMKIAEAQLRNESPLTLIDPPALVREAYLRLAHQEKLPGIDRHAFFSYASRTMRSVIIDYVRSRNAERNRHESITLTTNIANQILSETQVDTLMDAMDELKYLDERAAQVVEMRFFGGMDIPEIAEVLSLSAATVKRDWSKARAFLFNSLNKSL